MKGCLAGRSCLCQGQRISFPNSQGSAPHATKLAFPTNSVWEANGKFQFNAYKKSCTAFTAEDFPIDVSIHATDRLGHPYSFEYHSPQFNVVILGRSEAPAPAPEES